MWIPLKQTMDQSTLADQAHTLITSVASPDKITCQCLAGVNVMHRFTVHVGETLCVFLFFIFIFLIVAVLCYLMNKWNSSVHLRLWCFFIKYGYRSLYVQVWFYIIPHDSWLIHTHTVLIFLTVDLFFYHLNFLFYWQSWSQFYLYSQISQMYSH